MKFKVLQENLYKSINSASRFVNTRAQLPVLANILIKANKGSLTISATNLEVAISSTIGAKIEEVGEITVPGKTLLDIVSNLGSGPIDFSIEKEHVDISSTNSKSVVSGMNSSDFPSIPSGVSKKAISVPQKEFVDGLSSVLFAVSSDETRPILTGVLCILGKTSLTLVATDGFRLSRKVIKGKFDVEKTKSVIIPKGALMEVLRLAKEGGEVLLDLSSKDNQVVFGVGDFVLATRILDGSFPDFEKIIPTRKDIVVDVDREELLRAVKLSSVFARDNANVVKLNIKKTKVSLGAESSSVGSQETSVDAKVEGLETKDYEIAFNFRFMEEVLNSIDSESVTVELTNPNAPGVFKNPNDPNYLHLIMPVKIQD